MLDYRSFASKKSRPYWYTTDLEVSLPNDTNVHTYYISIIAEADFMLHRLTSEQTGHWEVRITDTTTGWTFMNGFVRNSVLTGNSQYYRDIEPQLIQRKTSLQLDFINRSGGVNDVYFTMSGMNYHYDR